MSWSLKLLTIRGIPIRVHISFLLVLGWAAWFGLRGAQGEWLHGVIYMVAFVLLLFICVALHELGHSLMAQLFGVQVEDITLWPIGGVARMAQMPRQPLHEFLITAAGPAVNILLATLLGTLTMVMVGPQRMLNLLDPSQLFSISPSTMGPQSLLMLLTANNVILALFNLIPAFPMDGGRLLRALLAAVLPFGRATQIASVIGQVLATLIGMAGLLTGNYMLALVGMFVFLAAGQERGQTLTQITLEGLQVRQAMQPIGVRLHPDEPVGATAARLAAQPQAAYLVVDQGRVLGLVTRSAMLAALRRPGPNTPVGQLARRDFPTLSPHQMLTDVQPLLGGRPNPVALVIENNQVIGSLCLADLARLAEVSEAAPKLLPKM